MTSLSPRTYEKEVMVGDKNKQQKRIVMELILDKDISYTVLGDLVGCNVRITKDDRDKYRVHLTSRYNKDISYIYGYRFIENVANYVKRRYLPGIASRKIYWTENLESFRNCCRPTMGKIQFYEKWNGELADVHWVKEYSERTLAKYSKTWLHYNFYILKNTGLKKIFTFKRKCIEKMNFLEIIFKG